MMFRLNNLLVLVLVLVAGCQNKGKTTQQNNVLPDSVYIPKYASQFSIKYYQNHKVIEVNHPWDTLAPKQRMVLSNSDAYIKSNSGVIKTPVKRWVAVASTQISYANNTLGAMDALVGMAEPQYVSNPIVVDGIKKGSIKNIGTAFAPDLEALIDLEPDMMMVSPFRDDFYGPVRQAGINIATNSSYLENTPLGRVEWLVYVAAFFNQENTAIAQLDSIASRYYKIKKLTADLDKKPSMFSGKIYQGIWYAAAAQSYNANYYKDAGADYIFSDKEGTGSLSYDYETVYNAAAESDYWTMLVNYPGEYSYKALQEEDIRYKDFEAFNNKKVIVANTGNSNYYEEGLLRPDVVLSDLVKQFHPKLLPDYTPVYFKLMTKE